MNLSEISLYRPRRSGIRRVKQARAFLQELCRSSGNGSNPKYQNIAVVTHGGVIRILLTALFGGDFAKRLMFGTSLENCSITQLHYDEDQNGFYLDRFNDYAHLEQDPSLLRNHFKIIGIDRKGYEVHMARIYFGICFPETEGYIRTGRHFL